MSKKWEAQFKVTEKLVKTVIATVDEGLSEGLGKRRPGFMCVEAAVCYAMGLPHGDNPPCVHYTIRELKIRLNDSSWTTKAARAKGMRKLAVLQLGTADCGFNAQEFVEQVVLFTVKTILPVALTAAGLCDHANKCAAVTTLNAATAAATAAAAAVAYDATAAAAAVAYDAAVAAAVAATAAATAATAATAAAATAATAAAATAAATAVADAAATAARDDVLIKFADGVSNILIEMKVPAVEFLELLK